jgi:adenylate cyclase
VASEDPENVTLWQRLNRRGVVRVALSYLVIAWLILQIGDVILDPLGAPAWTMRMLIVLAALGFPVSLALAWFLDITPSGIEVDRLDDAAVRPRLRGIRHYADIVIIGALLVVVALLLVRQEGLIPETTATPVVAILPFEEPNGSEDNRFGDGFSDTLIHKLGMFDELVVLASSSTFEFRDSEFDIREVASRLGATILLTGSIRRAGGLLRLDARLVDGTSGQQLWSANIRRPDEDVFRLQDEIANAVVSTLGLQLSAAQVHARRTVSGVVGGPAEVREYLRHGVQEFFQGRAP